MTAGKRGVNLVTVHAAVEVASSISNAPASTSGNRTLYSGVASIQRELSLMMMMVVVMVMMKLPVLVCAEKKLVT